MNDIIKTNKAYKTIGEVAKELNLIDKRTGQLQTHTIRYWETQFKEIKPSIRAGKRRYYSSKDLKIINYIKYLLKDKGMTINGAKKLLNSKNIDPIDDSIKLGVYKPNLNAAKSIKSKIKNITKIIKEIKKLKNG